MASNWGPQPARRELRRQRWTCPQAAAQMDGVDTSQLQRAVAGRTRPTKEIRDQLPKLLGVPLEELFTPDILAKPFNPKMNPWRPL